MNKRYMALYIANAYAMEYTPSINIDCQTYLGCASGYEPSCSDPTND